MNEQSDPGVFNDTSFANVESTRPLSCPRCGYNLVGLTTPRCPECGVVFDWQDVWNRAWPSPKIAFERAAGWGRLLGFVVTWLTVMFVPWRFARQIVRRVSWKHALGFGAVCFVSTLFAVISGADWPYMAAWICTAAIYIVLQAVWLSLWDSRVFRAPWATLCFWLLVGCYTSAVMMTEFWQGPPLLTLQAVAEWAYGLVTGRIDFVGLYQSMIGEPRWLAWAQLMLWLACVSCCDVAARTERRVPPIIAVVYAVIVATGVFILYIVTVEQIGARLYELFGGRF